jgi:hypothetical protein
MTKLTMNSEASPAAQAIAKAQASAEVIDARGRIITLRKPGVLAQFRLIEALGDTAQNQVYMGLVLPLIFVSDIDGEAVVLPTRKSEVEALIQRLDEDGIEAVQQGVVEHFKASTPEQDKAAVKN